MYCKKCGKQFEGNADYCDDCFTEAVMHGKDETVRPDDTMRGFGKGLASAVTGFCAFIVTTVLNGQFSMWTVGMIALLIVSVAALVVSIVFGAQSIKLFSSYRYEGAKKPAPAFVLGIIGIVLASIAAVCVITFLCVRLPAILNVSASDLAALF